MTQSPILKALSTFQRHRIRSLLIGGQACIIYGAAEFSRDSDFVVLCSRKNLERLKAALGELKAENIYVPPLEPGYLAKGHACHFRCRTRGTEGLRIDIMAKLRGCGGFGALWRRRKTVRLPRGLAVNVIGLADLVQSKKTQRDKDWLMLGRLVQNDIILHPHPSAARVRWWLKECRHPETLVDLAARFRKPALAGVKSRLILRHALKGDINKLRQGLSLEENRERKADIRYWAPLRKELEQLRHLVSKAGVQT